jgi:hypothetical protein
LNETLSVLKSFPREYFSNQQTLSLVRMLTIYEFALNLVVDSSKSDSDLPSKILEYSIEVLKIVDHYFENLNLNNV